MHPLPVNEYSPARQCCSPVITQHFTEAAHYKILWINEHPSFVSQEMYRVYTRCQVHPKTYSRYAASLLFSKAASIILIPSFLKRKIDRDISRKQIQWLKFQCTLSVWQRLWCSFFLRRENTLFITPHAQSVFQRSNSSVGSNLQAENRVGFFQKHHCFLEAKAYKPKLDNMQLANQHSIQTQTRLELRQQVCGQTTKRGVSGVCAGKGMGNYRAAPQLKGKRIFQLTGSLFLSIYWNSNFPCHEFSY